MKIAIVTGASSGLGKEFVKQINKYYSWLDEIWLIARREDRMKSLAGELSIKARIIQADLTKISDIKNISLILKEVKPQVKLLVNNAGYGKVGKFEDISLDENLGMIDLNMKALTQLTYLCLPYCHRGSRIIQVASVAGFMPQPQMAVYAASKAYVLSFSQALSEEVKSRGITVTALCPGPVHTEFFEIAGEFNAIKKDFFEEPSTVVSQAIMDAAKGKVISISSLAMKGLQVVGKLVPNQLIFKVMDKFLK